MASSKAKKILMVGWEYPPYNSGGLGVACRGIAKALASRGHKITFVLPHKMEVKEKGIDFIFAQDDKNHVIPPFFSTYAAGGRLFSFGGNQSQQGQKTKSLIEEVFLYGLRLANILKNHDFDLIHVHDWLSFPAGIILKERYKKPLVAHIHALEFDRCAGMDSWRFSEVAKIEKEGLLAANRIIAVSRYTKKLITDCYNISPDKIDVAYNGLSLLENFTNKNEEKTFFLTDFLTKQKLILFVGRLTAQKGIDYFLKAAQIVSAYYPETIFVIVGDGELKGEAVELAKSLGISKQVFFGGFLRGEKLAGIYHAADVFVMPSVSEPFGISPLEAASRGAAVIVSKTSGVSEVLKGALRVDFWDTKALAEKIISLLSYKTLQTTLSEDGKKSLNNLTWDRTAQEIERVYEKT